MQRCHGWEGLAAEDLSSGDLQKVREELGFSAADNKVLFVFILLQAARATLFCWSDITIF